MVAWWIDITADHILLNSSSVLAKCMHESVYWSKLPDLFQRWKDPWLMWNPDDYGGQKHLSVPLEEIWFPHIYHVNT